MLTRLPARIDRRWRWYGTLVGVLVSWLIACSSNSSGLKIGDGGPDGKADVVVRLDGAGPLDAGRGGTGGSSGRRDAALGEAGTIPVGSGGAIGIDGGVPTGGVGGRAGASGFGGAGRGGATGTAAAGGSTGGRGGSTLGSGGAAGRRTGGAPGSGGAVGGTGGTGLRDAAPATDAEVDAPLAPDAGIDGAGFRRDASSARPDTAPVLDGALACGYLDEPCCEQRTCGLPSLICASGGGGGEGTCVVCGGEGEACCEDDVCVEPNTVCVGGGRGGGTCRAQ